MDRKASNIAQVIMMMMTINIIIKYVPIWGLILQKHFTQSNKWVKLKNFPN